MTALKSHLTPANKELNVLIYRTSSYRSSDTSTGPDFWPTLYKRKQVRSLKHASSLHTGQVYQPHVGIRLINVDMIFKI